MCGSGRELLVEPHFQPRDPFPQHADIAAKLAYVFPDAVFSRSHVIANTLILKGHVFADPLLHPGHVCTDPLLHPDHVFTDPLLPQDHVLVETFLHAGHVLAKVFLPQGHVCADAAFHCPHVVADASFHGVQGSEQSAAERHERHGEGQHRNPLRCPSARKSVALVDHGRHPQGSTRSIAIMRGPPYPSPCIHGPTSARIVSECVSTSVGRGSLDGARSARTLRAARGGGVPPSTTGSGFRFIMCRSSSTAANTPGGCAS